MSTAFNAGNIGSSIDYQKALHGRLQKQNTLM